MHDYPLGYDEIMGDLKDRDADFVPPVAEAHFRDWMLNLTPRNC